MQGLRSIRRVTFAAPAILAVAAALLSGSVLAADPHMTGPFKGVKVNGGTVTHSKNSPANVLTLSDDFVVPDTPAPHWQVVDSKGNVYLLNRLEIKDGKSNKSITVPAYVNDIAKVQIWCAFAETLLGEASFPKPVR